MEALQAAGLAERKVQKIEGLIGHAQRQIKQVDRRLLQGEVIPHEEKVFAVFEEHTRWIAKGKSGVAVELGVPVCVVEDQHQFLLHHKVLWKGSDVGVAVPMIWETQKRYPDLQACSFDRGFHTPGNRVALDRVRSRGADGFKRTVALSVLGANIHRMGRILLATERKKARRRALRLVD